MKKINCKLSGTLTLDELETGDIIATKGHTWLARQIRKFMRIQARKKYGVKLDKYFNHTVIVTNPPTHEIAEAIGRGLVIHNIFEQYKKSDLKNMIVFRPRTNFSDKEKKVIQAKAIQMAKKNIEYELLNFLWWAPYILSNGKIDLSPKPAKKSKKVFCFEAAAMIFNSARVFFTEPDKASTVDMQMDERLLKFKLKGV